MGWFDALLSGLGVSGGTAGAIASAAGDLVNIGGRIYSMAQLQEANDRAAAARTAGLDQAAGIITDAYGNALPQFVAGQNQAADAIEAGQRAGVRVMDDSAARSSAMFTPYAEAGQPAIDFYRTVLGRDPFMLSPQQAIEYDDATRRANNRLATSGLRGSGRAVAAINNDLQNRTRAGMIETNRAEQRDAASRLMAGGLTATGQKANIETNRGRYAAGAEETIGATRGRAAENIANRTADTTMGVGRARAGAAEGSSTIQANRGTANAELGADTLGNITSIIAGNAKAAQYNRPYYNDATGRSSGGGRYDSQGRELYGPGFKKGGKVARPTAPPADYRKGGRVRLPSVRAA